MSPYWVKSEVGWILGDEIDLGGDDFLIPSLWTLFVLDQISVESQHVLREVVLGDALDGLASLWIGHRNPNGSYRCEDLLDREHVKSIVSKDAS